MNTREKEECPICEEYTGEFIKEVQNGKIIELEYCCCKCGIMFAKVKEY